MEIALLSLLRAVSASLSNPPDLHAAGKVASRLCPPASPQDWLDRAGSLGLRPQGRSQASPPSLSLERTPSEGEEGLVIFLGLEEGRWESGEGLLRVTRRGTDEQGLLHIVNVGFPVDG